MIETLLLFYCKKDSRKRKKILQILDNLKFIESEKKFLCKSTTNPNKIYTVSFQSKKFEYFCDCKAALYKPYKTFEDLKERNRRYKKYDCAHITSCKIYIALNKISLT